MGIRSAWERLLEENGPFPPFLSHDWFQCCLNCYDEQKRIFILVVTDGSETVGIAPLWRYGDSVRRIKVRKIGFITGPDTPFVDFIVHKDRRGEILKTIVDHLYHGRGGTWEVLTLGQWPEESPNYAILKEILSGQHKNFFKSPSTMTPYIPIRGNWDAFLQTRPVRFRKTRRNIINRMGKLPKTQIQCHRQDTTGDVFKEILAVSEKSWKAQKEISISSWKEARQFFQAFTGLAGNRGWLLIWLLKTDGIPIAMEYDLECGGKVYALRADFDEAYGEYSPGAYLEYQIIKSLFDEGYLEYNTGAGLNSYKLNWTDQIRQNVALHVCNRNLRGEMIYQLENRVVPFLKRIRDRKWRSR